MVLEVLCVGILGLMVFVLGFNVSLKRVSSKVMTGVSDDPASALNKAVRAHGNLVEFAPMLAVLMLLAGEFGQPGIVADILIVAATLGRVLAATGFLVCETLDKPHPLKAVGAILTYLGGAGLAVQVVIAAFV